MHISDDEFERAIEQVLDDLPERFARVLENVGIVVADEPNERELATMSNPCGELPDCMRAYSASEANHARSELQRRDAGRHHPVQGPQLNAYAQRRPSCANGSANCKVLQVDGHFSALMTSICTRTATSDAISLVGSRHVCCRAHAASGNAMMAQRPRRSRWRISVAYNADCARHPTPARIRGDERIAGTGNAWLSSPPSANALAEGSD